MMVSLARFEIGYDRDYIGAKLHCLDCPPGDHGPADVADVADLKLSEVVAAAAQHQAAFHPSASERGNR